MIIMDLENYFNFDAFRKVQNFQIGDSNNFLFMLFPFSYCKQGVIVFGLG